MSSIFDRVEYESDAVAVVAVVDAGVDAAAVAAGGDDDIVVVVVVGVMMELVLLV